MTFLARRLGFYIAAFFVDLRGFTTFTNAVSAERVMRVLDEYYQAVGSLLDEHGATIGGFDGDGVFAYLGDPVPHDDTPSEAIAMARAVACRFHRLQFFRILNMKNRKSCLIYRKQLLWRPIWPASIATPIDM